MKMKGYAQCKIITKSDSLLDAVIPTPSTIRNSKLKITVENSVHFSKNEKRKEMER